MKPGWRTVDCSRCVRGLIDTYVDGPRECPDCGGDGELWIRPTGHLFMYPGGPARGQWSKEAYLSGCPWSFGKARLLPVHHSIIVNRDREE